MSRFGGILFLGFHVSIASAGGFLNQPLENLQISCDFCGYKWASGECHQAIDYRARTPASVFASADGRIIAPLADGLGNTQLGGKKFDQRVAYGNHVRIRHPNGYTTIYAHLQSGSLTVSVGDEVRAGQQLGITNNSGWSSAPHLHFEVRDPSGKRVDPYDRLIEQTRGCGATASVNPPCGANSLWMTCPNSASQPPQIDGGTTIAGCQENQDCNTGLMGECAKGKTACVNGVAVCHQVIYPTSELCNELDDNCNGQVDEPWKMGRSTDLGQPCSVGRGACARDGVWECAPNGASTVCSATPGEPTREICDGIDNNCDGIVDNPLPVIGQVFSENIALPGPGNTFEIITSACGGLVGGVYEVGFDQFIERALYGLVGAPGVARKLPVAWYDGAVRRIVFISDPEYCAGHPTPVVPQLYVGATQPGQTMSVQGVPLMAVSSLARVYPVLANTGMPRGAVMRETLGDGGAQYLVCSTGGNCRPMSVADDPYPHGRFFYRGAEVCALDHGGTLACLNPDTNEPLRTEYIPVVSGARWVWVRFFSGGYALLSGLSSAIILIEVYRGTPSASVLLGSTSGSADPGYFARPVALLTNQEEVALFYILGERNYDNVWVQRIKLDGTLIPGRRAERFFSAGASNVSPNSFNILRNDQFAVFDYENSYKFFWVTRRQDQGSYLEFRMGYGCAR